MENTNLINKHRKLVYHYFDSILVPFLEKLPMIDKIGLEMVEKKAKTEMKDYRWVAKKYGNTVRVSAWIDGLNYLFFMVWTPKELPEYEGWGDVMYHGSRKK